jgi:MFS family permease
MTRQRSRERIDDRWQVSPRRPDGRRGRTGPHVGPIRVTPTKVLFAVAFVGSVAYLGYAITVRDASSIPMLASGAFVLGLVFVALAIAGAVLMRQASLDRQGSRSILMAVGGGLAAMVAAGCFAGAVVLALVGSA